MQIRLTVLGPLSGHTPPHGPHATRACDVLVTAPAGTALASVASGLAAAAAAAGCDLGSGAVVVYAGAERLDAQRCALGEPPLIDGAVLSLGAPADPDRHAGVLLSGVPEAAARLHVVSGPDAGGVHLLHGGEVRIGRSSSADVPLDDPDVSRLHCAVTVSDDGAVTLHDLGSTNGTVLDGTPVDGRPVPFPSGTLLRVGESTLSLHSPSDTSPRVLPAAPDGEGHLRVSAGTVPGSAGQPRGTTSWAEGSAGFAGAGGGYAGVPGPARAPQAADPAPAGGFGDARGGPAMAHATAGPARTAETHQSVGIVGFPGPTGFTEGYFGSADAVAPSGFADPSVPGPRHHTGFVGAPDPCTPDYTPEGYAPDGYAPGGHITHGGRGTQFDVPDDRGTPPVVGEERAEGKRGGRNRGIGAWARRLTGGRGAERAVVAEEWPPSAEGDAERARALAESLRERWPDPACVLLTALGPGPRLWERGPDHPDLLTVRLGTTDRYAADGSGLLPSVPVTVALREVGALGLAGPRERLSGLARSVLAQLAALHSPAALEFVLISADRSRSVEERLAEWSWLGWLPQLRPTHGQDCRLLVAYDREQAEARTAELVRRLDDGPLGPNWASAAPEAVASVVEHHTGPYTILIVDGDPGSSALRETVSRLATGGPAAGIHLLCLADAPATTPASPVSATLDTARAVSPAFPQCGAVALLSGDVATVVQVLHRGGAAFEAGAGPQAGLAVPGGYGPADGPPALGGHATQYGGTVPPPAHGGAHPASAPGGSTVIAAVDAVSAAWAERFARALAPLRMADAHGAHGQAGRVVAALPRTARLLDELGLARATPASLTARWAAATDRGARPGGRAVAVLGAGPHGPLTVDLAADGPHLLVEGGPGCGKTELLRSLAASLAAADRPDRLSLVLVDGAGAERGEGLRVCTDLPHVSTYLAAADPVRMREFAQALSSELKRRADLLGRLDFCGWHAQHTAAQIISPRRPADAVSGDLDPAPSGTLKLRAQKDGPARTAETALPRLVVLVDDFDALVAPALGSTGRPAAGSVVRALESVARDGERLGVHLVAASGRPDRTADTAAVERSGLRVTLEIAPASADGAGDGSGSGEPAPGRGRLQRPDDDAMTPFQAGRVTGRIPRTATLRPTVVPVDWQRMGDPPTRRPLRELGNGPTDLALLASALLRAAQSAGTSPAPSLLPPDPPRPA
ncbi:FtsK/SpoIIIE domain-containing protein [Streptomyces syringium]|uniref:FtsK/SpoIIIE domain-containing protein n=1 Tax=Streptomyces syringium TaxID=76729 RepID=UPI0036E852C8